MNLQESTDSHKQSTTSPEELTGHQIQTKQSMSKGINQLSLPEEEQLQILEKHAIKIDSKRKYPSSSIIDNKGMTSCTNSQLSKITKVNEDQKAEDESQSEKSKRIQQKNNQSEVEDAKFSSEASQLNVKFMEQSNESENKDDISVEEDESEIQLQRLTTKIKNRNKSIAQVEAKEQGIVSSSPKSIEFLNKFEKKSSQNAKSFMNTRETSSSCIQLKSQEKQYNSRSPTAPYLSYADSAKNEWETDRSRGEQNSFDYGNPKQYKESKPYLFNSSQNNNMASLIYINDSVQDQDKQKVNLSKWKQQNNGGELWKRENNDIGRKQTRNQEEETSESSSSSAPSKKQLLSQFQKKLLDQEVEITKLQDMVHQERRINIELRDKIKYLKAKCVEYELGIEEVRKQADIITKEYEVKQLKTGVELERQMYQQFNEDLRRENSEILSKAGRLLTKYKELECKYELTEVQKEEIIEVKGRLEERDKLIRELQRENKYLTVVQFKELSELKKIVEDTQLSLEVPDIYLISSAIYTLIAQNKKLMSFQTNFTNLISTCRDPQTNNQKTIQKNSMMSPMSKGGIYQSQFQSQSTLPTRQTSPMRSQSPPIKVKEETVESAWALFKQIFQDYLTLRKNQRLDKTLGDVLCKTLRVSSRHEIIPIFTQKVVDNESYASIITKLRNHLKINEISYPLPKLAEDVDQLLQKKSLYS